MLLSMSKTNMPTLGISRAFESMARSLLQVLFSRHSFNFQKSLKGHLDKTRVASYLFKSNHENLAYYEIIMSVIYRDYEACGRNKNFFETVYSFVNFGLFSQHHNPVVLASIKKERVLLLELQQFQPKLLSSSSTKENPSEETEEAKEGSDVEGNSKMVFMNFKLQGYSNKIQTMTKQLWSYLANSFYLGLKNHQIERNFVREVVKSLNDSIHEIQEKSLWKIPFIETDKIELVYQVNELLSIFDFEESVSTGLFDLQNRKPLAKDYEKPL